MHRSFFFRQVKSATARPRELASSLARCCHLTNSRINRASLRVLPNSRVSQQAQDGSTKLARMNEWGRNRLATLQSSLGCAGIESTLEKSGLFRAVDYLLDPEEEPPKDPHNYC